MDPRLMFKCITYKCVGGGGGSMNEKQKQQILLLLMLFSLLLTEPDVICVYILEDKGGFML